jgi:hypothetical protein
MNWLHPKSVNLHPLYTACKIHAWLNPIGIPQTSSQSQSFSLGVIDDRFLLVNDRSPDGLSFLFAIVSSFCITFFFFLFIYFLWKKKKNPAASRSIYINEYKFSYVCDFLKNNIKFVFFKRTPSREENESRCNLNSMKLKMNFDAYHWSPIFIVIIEYINIFDL